MSVDGVNLLRNFAFLKQNRGFVLLSDQDDSLGGDNSLMRTHVPIAEPVLLMASTAYSSCCNLPSGENVVVLESYLRDMLLKNI